MDRIPCRVSQDLRRYQAAQDRNEMYAEEFDALNDDHCVEAAGKILGPAIQTLLEKEAYGLDQVSPARMREIIRDIHEAMKTAWEENQ